MRLRVAVVVTTIVSVMQRGQYKQAIVGGAKLLRGFAAAAQNVHPHGAQRHLVTLHGAVEEEAHNCEKHPQQRRGHHKGSEG